MTTESNGDAVDVWRDQRLWSKTASRLKRSIVRWRSVALTLAILGAVLATLATQVGLKTGLGQILSVGAAVTLAVLPVIRGARLGKDRIENWTRARSVSEGLKAEMYLYLAKAPPYRGEDRDSKLLELTNDILRQVDDIAGQTVGVLAEERPLPAVSDVESYLTKRVRPQIDEYYTEEAGKQQRRLSLFRGVEYALAGLGAVLGAIAAATKLDSIGIWVAVVTTVGAAVTAHIASARYEHHVISYNATARQLRHLERQWRARRDKTPEIAAELVRRCEDTISRENESWMAAWSRGEDPALPAPASP